MALMEPETNTNPDNTWADLAVVDGALLSFDRCIDWLLTLYGSTCDPTLRSLVVDVLDDLRELGPVEGEFEDVVLEALASVRTAFEIRGRAA